MQKEGRAWKGLAFDYQISPRPRFETYSSSSQLECRVDHHRESLVSFVEAEANGKIVKEKYITESYDFIGILSILK